MHFSSRDITNAFSQHYWSVWMTWCGVGSVWQFSSCKVHLLLLSTLYPLERSHVYSLHLRGVYLWFIFLRRSFIWFDLHEIRQEYCLHWILLIGKSCPRYISVFILMNNCFPERAYLLVYFFSFLPCSYNKCIWIKDKKQTTWLNN